MSPRTIASWSGLTGLQPIVERLRPHLRNYHDENGQVLWDTIDGRLPDEDTPAPVRFLGEFDNTLLSYHNRTRIMRDNDKINVFTKNGIIRATVLIDGFVSGLWSIEEQRGTATLQINPFRPISSADQAALHEEGVKLLTFAAADAAYHEIRFL